MQDPIEKDSSHRLASKKIAIVMVYPGIGQREPRVFPHLGAQRKRAWVRDKSRQEAGDDNEDHLLPVQPCEGADMLLSETTAVQGQIGAAQKEVRVFPATAQGPVLHIQFDPPIVPVIEELTGKVDKVLPSSADLLP